jgi:hypothetical protein
MKILIELKHNVSIVDRGNDISVMVEDSNGCSQFPIMYSPRGIIACDAPERITEAQRKEVRRAFNMFCPAYWKGDN